MKTIFIHAVIERVYKTGQEIFVEAEDRKDLNGIRVRAYRGLTGLSKQFPDIESKVEIRQITNSGKIGLLITPATPPLIFVKGEDGTFQQITLTPPAVAQNVENIIKKMMLDIAAGRIEADEVDEFFAALTPEQAVIAKELLEKEIR